MHIASNGIIFSYGTIVAYQHYTYFTGYLTQYVRSVSHFGEHTESAGHRLICLAARVLAQTYIKLNGRALSSACIHYDNYIQRNSVTHKQPTD